MPVAPSGLCCPAPPPRGLRPPPRPPPRPPRRRSCRALYRAARRGRRPQRRCSFFQCELFDLRCACAVLAPAGPAPPAPAPQPPPSCCSFALPRSSQLLPCAPRSRSRSLAMSAEAKYREGMAALERAGKAYAAAPRAHALARGLMQVTHIPLLSAAQARTGRRQRLQRPLQKARLRDRGRRVQQGRSVANPCRPSAPHARACSADRTQPPDVAAGTSRASPRHVLPQRQVVRTGQAGLPQG